MENFRGSVFSLKLIGFFFLYSYLCRTDPADVARVEAKTWISTEDRYETVPHVREGVKGCLGQWIAPKDLEKEMGERYPGCMKGLYYIKKTTNKNIQ